MVEFAQWIIPLNAAVVGCAVAVFAAIGLLLRGNTWRVKVASGTIALLCLYQTVAVLFQYGRLARADAGRQSTPDLIVLAMLLGGILLLHLEIKRHNTAHSNTSLVEELRRRNEQLQVALVGARQAEQTKHRFLANISHEIRTPMNGIVGMTELLLISGLNREQREYAQAANESAGLLLHTLDGLLDLAQIGAGRMALKPTTFSPRRTLQGVVSNLSPRADAKGITLSYRAKSGFPEAVIGDPNRVGQVLRYLVDNAIKFTERGEVWIRGEQLSEDLVEVVLRFTVKDTGIGMTDDELRQVFERFHQVDDSLNRRNGGVGLGLTISRHLAEMMGGSIEFESEPGQGSIVRFTAPMGKAEVSQEVARTGVPISCGPESRAV